MMNLFQASVKLIEKTRIGSKVKRRYDEAKTPLDRLIEYYGEKAPLPLPVQRLIELRENIDPFELSQQIEKKLKRIEQLRRECRDAEAAVL